MAGTGGFEPPDDDTKNRCLTTWRRPILTASSHDFDQAEV